MKRNRRFPIALALWGTVMTTVLPTTTAAEPIIPRSLAQLGKAPPASPEAFDFVVAGDTHSNRQLVYQTDLFNLKTAVTLPSGEFPHP